MLTLEIENGGAEVGVSGRVLSVLTMVHWLAKNVLKIFALSCESDMKRLSERIGGITENFDWPISFFKAV